MKYEVHLRQIDEYIIEEVEADSEEDADKKAWSLFEADRQKYYHDSGWKTDVFEIGEET